jgi:hypothetical protein
MYNFSVQKRAKSCQINLVTLQKFLSTYVFHNSLLNDILVKDKHYILKDAQFELCPRQQNSNDCTIFGLGTLLHAVHGLPIDDDIFYQDNITLFRKELHRTLSTDMLQQQGHNPFTLLSKEFIISFYLKLYYHYVEYTNIESDYFIQMMRKNNEVTPNNELATSAKCDEKEDMENNNTIDKKKHQDDINDGTKPKMLQEYDQHTKDEKDDEQKNMLTTSIQNFRICFMKVKLSSKI